MVYGKSAKILPLLRRTKLSKKAQEIMMKLKKIYKVNKWWNDWKSKLHWNNLEWANPKYLNKKDKPYSVSSK